MNITYLQDKDFLRRLDLEHIKEKYVKIIVLDKNEQPITSIEGRVSSGNITKSGSSSVRRTASLTFLAEDDINDLTDIDSLLSVEKRIAIFTGCRNTIDRRYDDIVWFPQGIFVIIQPNLNHTLNGVQISLSCKDKMCLLNGECGGGLPTSVTFHEYDQVLDDGSIEHVPQRFYDIIQTAVCNFGGIPISKIFISDIPLQIKQIVRYVGKGTLFYNTATGIYTVDQNAVNENSADYLSFSYNEDVGYVYTDFIYPGELITGIGDNVCTVLDKLCEALGNFEYFFDENGNFIFQEVKNYLNKSYDPTDEYRLDNGRKIDITENELCVINGTNYKLDIKSNTKSVYTFDKDTDLVVSYSNAPKFNNIKNDIHVWGKNENGYAIHYHLAIKNKPVMFHTYNVVYELDSEGEYTGGIRLLTPKEEEFVNWVVEKDPGSGDMILSGEGGYYVGDETEGTLDLTQLVIAKVKQDTLKLEFAFDKEYTPTDWRAELYLQGLVKQMNQIRPDVYEQELLDLFPMIYNFKEKKFRLDDVKKPNQLQYFFDYLDPSEGLYDVSVDTIGARCYSYQQDKIKKIYNVDIPDMIMINHSDDIDKRLAIQKRCELEGQRFSNVDEAIYQQLSVGTIGYTAQETMRELLYQYTNYMESINITCIPIPYLDVNSRITVNDDETGIHGDFIINSITLPLGQGTMSISASKALERI